MELVSWAESIMQGECVLPGLSPPVNSQDKLGLDLALALEECCIEQMVPTTFGPKVHHQNGGTRSGNGDRFQEETCGNKSCIAPFGPGVRQGPPFNVFECRFLPAVPKYSDEWVVL